MSDANVQMFVAKAVCFEIEGNGISEGVLCITRGVLN